jgi:hypothetical protein
MKNFFKKIQEFLKAIISVDGKISSKRFLAVFVFTPVLIIALFTGFPVEVLWMVSGLVATLLGITTVEKFRKDYGKTQ